MYHCQANSLHKQCLDKLPEVYSTPLWKTMETVMEIIKNFVRVSSERLSSANVMMFTNVAPTGKKIRCFRYS